MMSVTKRNLLALVGGLAMVGFAAPLASAQATDSKPAQPSKEKGEHKEHKEHKGEHKQDGGKAKSTGAKVGEPAPAFELKDTDGKTVKLADLRGKIVVLEWFNPECPFVKKHHGVAGTTMSDTYNKYKDKNVVWLAVNSGAAGKQGAGLEANAKARKDFNMAYPVLLDESGTVGTAYGAKNTPTMYIIDEKGTLVYRGAIDNDPSQKLGDVNYVDQALKQVTAKETVSTPETKPYGCSIKYARGS